MFFSLLPNRLIRSLDITLLKLLINNMKIKCALQMNEVYSLEDFCDIILLSLEHEILKLSLQNSG